MNDKAVQYGLIGVLIGGALVWMFMTTRANPAQQMMSEVDSRGSMVLGTQMDAHFIEQMIPHHEDAVTMAELALQKSQRNEIKELAQAIISSQSMEIDQMKEWYSQWFGRELPTGGEVMQHHGMMSGGAMHMGMLGTQADMERLEQAEDFDKAFIEHMITHHQMAVMMASMLKNGTTRPEMEKLADDIIAAQTSEIDQMREWYDAWF